MDGFTSINTVLIVILFGLLYYQYDTQRQHSENFCGELVTPHEAASLRTTVAAAGSTVSPAAFVHPPSVYSSLPPESHKDASWKYTMPYQEACLGSCQRANGQCERGQKLTCVLTPHNQRVCSWK
jgi:hypothetical protein